MAKPKAKRRKSARGSNAALRLLDAIQSGVRKAQAKLDVAGLAGKYVRRNGAVYLVVSVGKKHVVLSNTETEVKQTTRMSRKAFVSKAVEPLD